MLITKDIGDATPGEVLKISLQNHNKQAQFKPIF
jgi:hypothetical protein